MCSVTDSVIFYKFTEIERLQASGRIPLRDKKYMDVFHEKPVKVTVKALVPIKEHPKVI